MPVILRGFRAVPQWGEISAQSAEVENVPAFTAE